VARASAGWIRETMPEEWRGFSFETLVLGELRAFNSYRRKERRLFHYSVTGAFDVDFVVETRKKVFNRPARFVVIEAKASSEWRPEWTRPLATVSEHGSIDAAYGVYLGKKTIVNDTVTVLPFAEFSRRLWAGDIF
jgi:hypothetical protein